MNDINAVPPPPVPKPKWVRRELYCAITGHTRQTLYNCRASGVWVYGKHYKSGPEGKKTYYYNVEAIDRLITGYKEK